MKTKYVTPSQFSRVSNRKNVVDYPNPWIKDVNGIRYHIVNPDMKYKISELSKEQYPWYLGMTYERYAEHLQDMFGDTDARVLVLECEWFPTELVAGVKGCKYSNISDLSRKTGWIRSFGTIELFRASCIDEAISILNRHNFMFTHSMLKAV